MKQLHADFARWLESSSALREPLDELLRRFNGQPGQPASFAALHELISEQRYRLARWKAGAHEINYRRFFAIDSLVGLHVEDAEVFSESHALIAQLLREDRITGLRIDHIDGLRQPANYLEKLQTLERPDPTRPLYVLVEKILAPAREELPENWAAHGTTGYEFISQLAGLFVHRSAEEKLRSTYARLTGQNDAYAEIVYAQKRLILDELFANAVENLGTSLATITSNIPRWQDLTGQELIIAVREMLAALSVYRTYRTDLPSVALADRVELEAACSRAMARNPRFDPQPLEFVRDVLAGDYPPPELTKNLQRPFLEWVLTFQQYSGAVMAKAVEDTAFYVYCPLIALNEVGGNPGSFGAAIADFHALNQARLQRTPHSLLATSTHDTKLSEDVRARLYALSEMPARWENAVIRWQAFNQRHLTSLGATTAPDRLDEFRFYQVLLGAWPLLAAEVDDTFRERLRTHFRKAVNEAKRHTSPLQPNELYLQACDRFVDAVTSAQTAPAFLADFEPFAQQLARIGMVNALAQLVLKCTVPGVPDFYQGEELWDFSLVDPDNRRAVDYERRREMLAQLSQRAEKGSDGRARTPLRAASAQRNQTGRERSPVPTTDVFDALSQRTWTESLEQWRDGGIKMRTMQALLQLRAREAEFFRAADYTPLDIHGSFAEHAVAFVRRKGGKQLLVVVPRLVASLGCPPLGLCWDDTLVATGDEAPALWRCVFTGRILPGQPKLKLATLFETLPFAVLESVESSTALPS